MPIRDSAFQFTSTAVSRLAKPKPTRLPFSVGK